MRISSACASVVTKRTNTVSEIRRESTRTVKVRCIPCHAYGRVDPTTGLPLGADKDCAVCGGAGYEEIEVTEREYKP